MAKAERWPVSRATLFGALGRSAGSRFKNQSPSTADLETYLQSLHLEDLALACACADGKEAAWDHFVREFRPALYAAARAIAGESNARELADSLYAELYGATSSATPEKRRSLFIYFHGRSKLSTWLRAVLAQRHVDAIRAGRRTESLDDDEAGASEARRAEARTPAPEHDPDRPRLVALLQDALARALAELQPRDRLRLSYYYLQDLTLAQIGRLLGEHEATASRKLERSRRDIRNAVERVLRESSRLSEAQMQLCFQYAVEDWHFDLFAGSQAEDSKP